MKTLLIAGASLACLGLGACGTLPLTGNPAADVKTAAANVSAVNSSLAALNQAAVQQILLSCGIDVDASAALSGGVIIAPPTLSGKFDFKCHIDPGQLRLVNGQIISAAAAQTTLGLSPAAIGTPAAPVSK